MKSWLALAIVGVATAYLYLGYAHMYNDRGALPILDPSPEVTTINEDDEGGGAGLVYAALGDSLTAGTGVSEATQTFPYQLGVRLSGENNFPVTVVNQAVPGAVAADVLRDQVPQLQDRYTDIVTVMIGTNDVHNRTPLPEFKQSMEKIVAQLHERDGQLYIINIPFSGDKKLMWPPYRTYIDWRTQQYNKIIGEVADAQGVLMIDLYAATKSAAWAGGDYYSVDQFHPSAKGYLLWSSIIYDALNH